MAFLSTGASMLVSFIMSALIFSAVQLNVEILSSCPTYIFLTGLIGALMFMFTLTAIANFECMVFEETFQAKIFPEVFIAILCTMVTCSLVDRVSITLGVIFSIGILRYMNKISSNSKYQYPAPVKQKRGKKMEIYTKSKKKN